MGAAKQIKQAIRNRGMTIKEFASLYNPDSDAKDEYVKAQIVRSMLYRDNMTYETIEQMADVLGYDIKLVDRETGEII